MSAIFIDTSAVQGKFPWRGFMIQHGLSQHELFTLPNLLALSRYLPENKVEYNAGDLPVGQDPRKTPHNGLSIQETIARIETCRSWMVLKNVEQHPDYHQLLDAVLDEIDPLVNQPLGKHALKHCGDREAFIFISSAGSVTPFHIDPEHNFLLQIRGEKTMRQWDWRDRSLLPDASIERTYLGDYVHRNLEYQDTFAEKAEVYTLKPGDGVYVPVHAPHWVANGAEVSISFSITFRSDYSRRNARLYHANARLRRSGFNPAPVGKSPFRDTLKDLAYRAYTKAEDLIKRGVT